jgi:hypothetical protein
LLLLLRVAGSRAEQRREDDDPDAGSSGAPHFPILDGFAGAAPVTNCCRT